MLLKNFSSTHSVAVCLCWQYLYLEKNLPLFPFCCKKQSKTRQNSRITLPYWFISCHRRSTWLTVFRINDQTQTQVSNWRHSFNHECFITTLSQERFWGPSLVILNSSLWLLQRVHQGHMTMIKMNSYIDTCPFLVLLDSWIFQKDYIRPINHVLCYFSVTIIQEESWENAWSEIIYFIMYSFKLYMTEIWLCVKVVSDSLWHMDYIVHGILQARILEWVDFCFSRASSQPRDRTQVSRIGGGFFTSWAIREAQEYWNG